ncbi:MAG: hypothetical protein ABIR91_03630 [Candidatus Saccharimonadales bacterium]
MAHKQPPLTPTNPSTTWRGAFKAYQPSKAVVKFNLSTILTLTVLSILAGMIPSLFDDRSADGVITYTPLGAMIEAIFFVVGIFLAIALTLTILAGIKRKKLSAESAVKQSYSYALSYFGMALVSTLLLAISLVAFIIPFFFVAPRIALAQYFLIDKKMGPIESIKASWHATKGHATKVWGIIGATLVMSLPILTIIGIPFAIYFLFMYSAAMVLLYAHLTRQKAQ